MATFDTQLPLYFLLPGFFLFSFLLAYYAIPTILRVAKEKGIFDIPNERSNHYGSIPRLGGIAIFLSISLSILMVPNYLFFDEFKYIQFGLIILFFLGLKDDILVLDPTKKIIGQLITAVTVVILADLRIFDMYGLFGLTLISYWVGVVISTLFLMAIINGFNLIDGIDGLASGIGILGSLFFTYWFLLMDEIGFSIVSASLAGALMAFFIYNVFGKRQKIFLGDTGAMIIGFLIGIFSLVVFQVREPGNRLLDPTGNPALIFALIFVPLFDTARVSILRIINGKSPFRADMNHIHHQIIKLGASHLKATLIILLFNVVIIFIPVLFCRMRTEFLLAALFIAGLIGSALLAYLVRRKQNG